MPEHRSIRRMRIDGQIRILREKPRQAADVVEMTMREKDRLRRKTMVGEEGNDEIGILSRINDKGIRPLPKDRAVDAVGADGDCFMLKHLSTLNWRRRGDLNPRYGD